MWRPLIINSTKYFCSFEITPSGQICVTLTDLVHIWKETVEQEYAIIRFKACNSTVDLSEQRIIKFLGELFQFNDGNLDVSLEARESDLILSISKILIIKMSYYFNLDKQSEKAVHDEITLPLLLVINELKHGQEQLFRQLEAKDCHLKEFDLEGFQITRKNVITPYFKRDEFEKELKSGLEQRIKAGLKNISSIITEDVNKVHSTFLRLTQPLDSTEVIKTDISTEEDASSKAKGRLNNKVPEKRCLKPNQETVICKRIKSVKKIIL